MRGSLRACLALLLSLLLAIGDPTALVARADGPLDDPPPSSAARYGVPASPMPTGYALAGDLHRTLIDLYGGFTVRFQDVSIGARGWPLAVERSYRSDLELDAGLGAGWGWSFGVRLGYDPVTITAALIALQVGSLIVQWPLGLLSDRFDRRYFIAGCATVVAILSTVLAVSGPLPIWIVPMPARKPASACTGSPSPRPDRRLARSG